MILATFGSGIYKRFFLQDVLSYFDGLCIRSEMEGAGRFPKNSFAGDRRAGLARIVAK
jgi:hypothetical protein